jgi:hypothetical protein
MTEPHPLPEPPRPWRPIRDRAALLERREALSETATVIDAEQQRLAEELTRIRCEMAEIRELLWPSTEGHAFHKNRRPGPDGPAAIPPPPANATPVGGRGLRNAALRVLLRSGGPLTLTEIQRALHLSGHVLLARDPVKQLGDALGYEERRGVVRRVARGTYEIGTLTPYRRREVERSR